MAADSLALGIALIDGLLSVDQRVEPSLPKNPVYPFVTVELVERARDTPDKRRVGADLRYNVWDTDEIRALGVIYEIEGVLQPASKWTAGFSGNVTVDGAAVYVWDVRHQFGPQEIPEPTGLRRWQIAYRAYHD